MHELRRLNLQELNELQTEPLDALVDARWPDAWRDFAYSCYCTLISTPLAVPGVDAAKLAVALVHGIAKDLGGTQPYIPVGNSIYGSAAKTKALALLGKGYCYKTVSDMSGITVSRVRNIEREHRKASRN